MYRRKIREKRGVFIERKSIANSEKARKCWAFEAMPSRAYESSFGVNGGGTSHSLTSLGYCGISLLFSDIFQVFLWRHIMGIIYNALK